MTKTKALYQYFSGFGLRAYPSNAVPSDVVFPWLTYEPIIADTWKEATTTVNLWYHTDSEATPNAKVDEIAQKIGLGGNIIPCDDGLIWIKKGNPFCQSVNDDSDKGIKRRYINLTLEYLSL